MARATVAMRGWATQASLVLASVASASLAGEEGGLAASQAAATPALGALPVADGEEYPSGCVRCCSTGLCDLAWNDQPGVCCTAGSARDPSEMYCCPRGGYADVCYPSFQCPGGATPAAIARSFLGGQLRSPWGVLCLICWAAWLCWMAWVCCLSRACTGQGHYHQHLSSSTA